MNATRPAILCGAFSTMLHAGDPKLDLDTRPPSKEAKDSVILPLPAPPPPRWSIGAGIVFRKLGDISFDTGTNPTMIPNLFGENSFSEPPGIGPLDAAADRSYDDGFVNIGAATPGTGLTTYWGYDDAGQVQDGNLVYSRSGGERRDVMMSDTADPTGWSNDSEWNAGPFLELTYSVPLRSHLTAGVAINFSSVNIDGSQGGRGTISRFQQLDVYDVTAVDTYSLSGIVPPAAPYAGSFAGPGPLIGNVPDSRSFPESLANTETAFFTDQTRFCPRLTDRPLESHVHWIDAERKRCVREPLKVREGVAGRGAGPAKSGAAGRQQASGTATCHGHREPDESLWLATHLAISREHGGRADESPTLDPGDLGHQRLIALFAELRDPSLDGVTEKPVGPRSWRN